jgi:hypothetical protein
VTIRYPPRPSSSSYQPPQPLFTQQQQQQQPRMNNFNNQNSPLSSYTQSFPAFNNNNNNSKPAMSTYPSLQPSIFYPPNRVNQFQNQLQQQQQYLPTSGFLNSPSQQQLNFSRHSYQAERQTVLLANNKHRLLSPALHRGRRTRRRRQMKEARNRAVLLSSSSLSSLEEAFKAG